MMENNGDYTETLRKQKVSHTAVKLQQDAYIFQSHYQPFCIIPV